MIDYVGLKNCNLPDPASGVYVNSLPGMTTEMVDKIASSEDVNFAGVWADIQNRAYLRLKNDVITEMFKYVKFNQVVYQTRKLMKAYPTGFNDVPASPVYTGVYQMMPESKYSEYRLNEIYVYNNSGAPVTTTLNVWDVNDGSVLYTQSVDLIDGLNTIEINKVFELRWRIIELFIGIDTSGFNSVETLNDFYYYYSNDGGCAAQATFGYGALRGVFQLYPATYDPTLPMVYNNIRKTGIGKGVAMGAELRCSVEMFIDENKQLLTQSWQYLLGCELLLEKIYQNVGSTRLNFFTKGNLEQTKELQELFEARYKNNLERTLDAIPLTGQGICFECEETFKVATKSMMP